MTILINILWLLTSIFMILVILVQRGKGGGLAGALGGVGGSSAFGTRAGDLFTKITVGVFLLWLFLGMSLVPLMTRQQVFQGGAEATNTPALNPNPADAGSGSPPADAGSGSPPVGPAPAENKAEEKTSESTQPTEAVAPAAPPTASPSASPATPADATSTPAAPEKDAGGLAEPTPSAENPNP